MSEAAQPPEPDPLSPDPLAAYQALRAAHGRSHDALARRQRGILLLLAATLLAFFVFAFRPVRLALASIPAALPPILPYALTFALFVYGVARYLNLQARINAQLRLLALYNVAVRRVDGTETQSGQTGPLPPVAHLYARDLDLFGPNSMFGLLATVRTTLGELGLTRYLLEPASQEESLLRQGAVRELAPQTRIREQIALLGASNLQRISANLIEEWLSNPPPTFHPVLRLTLLLTAALASALLLWPGLFRFHSFSSAAPRIAAVLAVQAALSLAVRQNVVPLLATSTRLQGSIRLFAEGLALLDSLHFTCPKLQRLQQAALQPAGAVPQLRRLQNQLAIAEQRGHGYFLPLSLFLAAGVQTAISIAAWKRTHAPAMRAWLAAWSEFEALNALATYAFEHPEDTWPTLLPPEHPPTYEAAALSHPLLPHSVTNDITLACPPAACTRFLLISGSNMSGKSTLLRSVGINAVLAYAGAPVRARSLRLTPLALGASLALTDSLAEGRSKFLAEVERLAAIVRLSASTPLLFLVDEIFSGTNSADRATAASAVLRQLLASGAIGALSTHDLALTALATQANAGENVHMASPNPEDPLAFDYKLKSGINTTSNALAIVRLMGLDT